MHTYIHTYIYSAWACAGQLAASTLFECLLWAWSGRHFDFDFNMSLGSFLLADAQGIFRRYKDTRPLNKKNNDNKITCGVSNTCVSRQISERNLRTQRGFVSGRNFLNNIVETDAAARVLSRILPRILGRSNWSNVDDLSAMLDGLHMRISDLPIIVLFDLCAAFPSVSHTWIFAVLKHSGLPQGFINVVRCMYTLPTTFVRGRRGAILAYFIWSGVLQGCPLSGTLFALSIEPILFWLSHAVGSSGDDVCDDLNSKHGFVRACADDIPGVLPALHFFRSSQRYSTRWLFTQDLLSMQRKLLLSHSLLVRLLSRK